MNNISFKDFQKLDLRVGKIVSAERVEGADKLLRLEVDTGDAEPRQLVAGLAKKYEPEELVGKRIIVLANLEPKELMGVESQGMLLAANGEDGPAILIPEEDVEPGAKVS